MSNLYVLAKNICPDYTRKAIRLRLVRTYIVHEGRNTEQIKSQECLFHDSEGTYVHGSIPSEYVPNFTNLLKEGKVYAIKNFLVISNYYQYKTTEQRYMIKFNHHTIVEIHKKKGFPKMMFRLKPLNVLTSGVVNDKQLIDVIGRVVEFYSPKEKIIGGYPSKLVDFLIEDNMDNRIMCTMWDEHVSTVMPYFNAHVEGPLVILIQLCRAKTVDKEVRISSSYNATKILFNDDSKEFLDFKASLKDNQTPMRSMNSMSVFSYGNSVEKQSNSTIIVSTIIDIYDRSEEGHYFVPARIVGLESGKKWYYTSCKTKGCYKKLEAEYNGLMKCDKCGVSWQEGSLRYRCVVRVRDKTGDAPFLLWDNEVTEFIGMTALSLKNKYPKDYAEIPNELESLSSKAVVFKVSVKNEHLRNPARPIPVLKILNDDALVSTYCTSWNDEQDQLSKMIEEEEENSDSDESESGDEASSPALEQAGKLRTEEAPIQSESGSIKRCLLDQFSSSQDVKRSKSVLIKQEKK